VVESRLILNQMVQYSGRELSMSRPSRGPSVVRKRSCNDWVFLDSRGRS
jgi:hypothetical protein